MTLKLHKITITDFRSFRGTHKFEFPQTSGLYFLSGKNHIDDLGANGAGKSSFLDAVIWCLYGRTSRGLKANDVLNWQDEKQVTVSLDLTVGTRFVVTRSQKPNNLLLNDQPIDQVELEKNLRINFTSFIYSVIHPQFGESFFALKAADKLTLFSDIMELDFWLVKSEEASVRTKHLEQTIEAIHRANIKLEGQLDLFNSELKDLKEKERSFATVKKKEVADLNDQAIEYTEAVTILIGRLADLKKDKINIITKRSNNRDEIRRYEDLIDRFLKVIQNNTRMIGRLEGELSALQRPKLGDICPACGQKVITGMSHTHERAKEGIIEKINLHKEYSHNRINALVECKNTIASLQSDKTSIDDKYNKLSSKISSLETELANTQDKVSEIKEAVKIKKSELNPYTKMLEERHNAIKQSTKALEASKKKLDEHEAELAATSFWVKGFKRVRLFIIEQAFQTLEVEVNNSLTQLGLANWQISFDIERENKSGGMTKGFMVFIKSPQNKEPVKWENWSGGETQRLQLAGDLGLANLIMQQAGLVCYNEFYDEPTTHMSQEGMIDLANLLHERANNEDKAIWISEHSAITNFGDFEGVIEVEKGEDGSRIHTRS